MASLKIPQKKVFESLTRTCHSVLPSPTDSCLFPDNKLLIIIIFASFPGDSLAFYSLFLCLQNL